MSIGERVDRLGGQGGRKRRPMGFLGPIGAGPVAGELGGRGGWPVVGKVRASLELTGEPLVQLAPFADGEIPLHDLAKQLVAKAVSAVREGGQDAAGRRLTEGHTDLSCGLGDERAEQSLVDRTSGHREGPDHAKRRRVQTGDARQKDVDQRRWDRLTGGLVGGRKEFLGKQRVTLGALPDRPDQIVGNRALAHCPELLLDIGPGQSAQVDPDGARCAAQLREPGEDGMAGRQVVGSAGQHGDDSLRRDVPNEERDQVVRRRIDPLDVLDDRQYRRAGAEAIKEAKEALEQASPID